MNPTEKQSPAERANWFAAGRVTVGKISTLNQSRKTFDDWFVGKLRGRIVAHPSTLEFKHKTAGEARACANEFRKMCRGQTTTA